MGNLCHCCTFISVHYTLHIFNSISATCACTLITIGCIFLFIHRSFDFLNELDALHLDLMPLIFIGLGTIMQITSILGFYGVIRDSRGALFIYVSYLFLCLLGLISVAIIIFLHLAAAQNTLDRVLQELWLDRNAYQSFWYTIQTKLECCGYIGAGDWGLQLPKSCCSIGTTAAPTAVLTGDARGGVDGNFNRSCYAYINSYQIGCLEASHEFIIKYSTVMGFTALACAAISSFGFFFACSLLCRLQRRY